VIKSLAAFLAGRRLFRAGRRPGAQKGVLPFSGPDVLRNSLEIPPIKLYQIPMSDQDTPPPPMNENSPESDAPPPIQDPAPIPMTAPPVGSVGLGQGKLQETDEKTMGMLVHILGGVTNFLGPLIIWLIKKDESPFVDDQGKEALNFQITVCIGFVVAGILTVIPVIGCIASLLIPALWIAGLIFGILGGLEANKGIAYRYPFALRLIS
jgi:uncharacterized protein